MYSEYLRIRRFCQSFNEEKYNIVWGRGDSFSLRILTCIKVKSLQKGLKMEKEKVLESEKINLSDFVLFLSVMKEKRAYQNALSIIMEEPDIQIREVKVEQVILNQCGKRAIRLDAWAVSEDERQFNMEMENHSGSDSIPKRSRFYQGLIDTPYLKSGKKTKYKQLPSTVIIFITQEDIFKRDLAKYAFTEKCKEVEDLELGDGTTKIFLNMTSKNGSKELISLLQYMRYTDINNPEIIVKDKRIIELDNIVTEVKSSEEWESVSMNIFEQGIARGIEDGRKIGIELGRKEGIEKGIKEGIKEGIRIFVEDQTEEKFSKEKIFEKLQKRFSLSEEEANAYYNEFTKELV